MMIQDLRGSNLILNTTFFNGCLGHYSTASKEQRSSECVAKSNGNNEENFWRGFSLSHYSEYEGWVIENLLIMDKRTNDPCVEIKNFQDQWACCYGHSDLILEKIDPATQAYENLPFAHPACYINPTTNTVLFSKIDNLLLKQFDGFESLACYVNNELKAAPFVTRSMPGIAHGFWAVDLNHVWSDYRKRLDRCHRQGVDTKKDAELKSNDVTAIEEPTLKKEKKVKRPLKDFMTNLPPINSMPLKTSGVTAAITANISQKVPNTSLQKPNQAASFRAKLLETANRIKETLTSINPSKKSPKPE